MSSSLYGLVAEFNEPEEILVAAEKAYDAGYRKMDAYSPFPVHGLAEAVGFKDNRLPWLIFFGGLLGAATGIGLEYYTSVMDYPMNVGGRPYFSWPSFIPVTFELTILLSSLTAVVGMIGLNGLPRPYHSIFNAKHFDRASQDKFFLCIEAEDPRFDREETENFLRSFHPALVSEVEK
jgi:hypothetical protein